MPNAFGSGGFVGRGKGKQLFQQLWAVATNIMAGLSGSAFAAAGMLRLNVTPAINTATNALQTLMSTTLPANAFDIATRGIYVKAWGVFAGNAQTKQVQLTIGGKSLASGSSTQSGVSWEMEGWIFKTGANAQAIFLKGAMGTTLVAPSSQTDTSTDSAAITIALQATDGSASATDITQNGLMVQYWP